MPRIFDVIDARIKRDALEVPEEWVAVAGTMEMVLEDIPWGVVQKYMTGEHDQEVLEMYPELIRGHTFLKALLADEL